MPEKFAKYLNVYDICPKINNIPEFYVIFARILHKNCQKSIFPEFFWGVGVRAPSPPSPTPVVLAYSYWLY